MYALLCSSSTEFESKDTPNGGAFTIHFHQVVDSGIENATYRNKPILTLDDISQPVANSLTKVGYPLPRLFIGPQLPQIGIAKHTAYKPETESFPPYFCRILELVWNNGQHREISIEEIGQEIGRGAYSNHSKLSYEPWMLLEDGRSRRYRKITVRGIQFINGKLAIPNKIIKNPFSREWVADPDSKMVYIQDIRKR
jgi:hypothetical protein